MSALQCAGWRPIVPTAEDVEVISDKLVLEIDGHMREGARKGCWRY